MAQFVTLGLKATNKLIDKHFDKVPDKAFNTDTYKPRKLRHRHRKSSSSSSSSATESDTDLQDIARGSGDGRTGNREPIGHGSSTQEQSQMSLQHEPPPLIRGSVQTPSRGTRERGRDRHARNDDDYHSDSAPPQRLSRTRPKAISRRSNSTTYHGPRHQPSLQGSNVRRTRHQHRRKSIDDERRDEERRSQTRNERTFREDMKQNFTGSNTGLGAWAVGAVVGAWAAEKAQGGTTQKRRGSGNTLLTILGAAAGGLAANAIVGRREDDKK